MAYIAPTAPVTFYDDGLIETKNKLDTTPGLGRLVLLSAMPADINNAWDEVGVADDSTQAGLNVGSAVLGFADLGTITGPVDGDPDPGDTTNVEVGRKLQLAAVADVPILDNANATAIAVALVRKVTTNANGVGADLVYIMDMVDLAVDGTVPGGNVKVNVPSSEIETRYSINKP